MPHQFQNSNSSVADLERHLSRKQTHAGDSAPARQRTFLRCRAVMAQPQERQPPPEDPFSKGIHFRPPSWCNSSTPRCGRGGAGAEPAEGTILPTCARQRAESAVCNTALSSASLGRTSISKQPSSYGAGKRARPVFAGSHHSASFTSFHRIRESQQNSLGQ